LPLHESRFLPNLHTHRFWVAAEKRFVSLRVSSNGMRVIDKRGIDVVLSELRARGEKHNIQEQTHHDGQTGNEKIRSGGKKARYVQGSQNQVIHGPLSSSSQSPASLGFFVSNETLLTGHRQRLTASSFEH